MVLHCLGISLLHVDGFSKVINSYIKTAYYSIYDDYHVNVDEICMNGDWFYTAEYGNFGDGGKATQISPPKKLTQCMITQPGDFMRKGNGKISRSVGAHILFNSHFPNSRKVEHSRQFVIFSGCSTSL